jgi:hypothetical protein
MITRDSEGQIRFHCVEDESEVTSALKEMFNSTEIGRDYKTNYYTKQTGDSDYEKLIKAAVQIAGGEMISIGDLTRALTLLIDSGELRSKHLTQAAQLVEPEEDNRPKGRDGKPLTDAQRHSMIMERSSDHELKTRTSTETRTSEETPRTSTQTHGRGATRRSIQERRFICGCV